MRKSMRSQMKRKEKHEKTDQLIEYTESCPFLISHAIKKRQQATIQKVSVTHNSAYVRNVANVIYTIGTLCAFIDGNTVSSDSHKNSWYAILYEHPPPCQYAYF